MRLIAMQLLLAVDLMNNLNIVHRDLKPENLLITMADEGLPNSHILDIAIADFGYATRLKHLSKNPGQHERSSMRYSIVHST